MPRVRLSSLLLALVLVWASACPPPGEEPDTGMPDTRVAKTPLACAPDCKVPNNNKILLGGKGYATKADCEKDRDEAFSAAANLQDAACKQKFFCSDPNCPNLRLFEPRLTGGLCACTKDPVGSDPAKPWRFGCDLTGKFQCCCQRDI